MKYFCYEEGGVHILTLAWHKKEKLISISFSYDCWTKRYQEVVFSSVHIVQLNIGMWLITFSLVALSPTFYV